MVILFGYETYYMPGRKTHPSRLASYFGIGNTGLKKGSTLLYWCREVVVYVFKFPLLMTGKYFPPMVVITQLLINFSIGIAILVTFTWPIGELGAVYIMFCLV